MDSNLVKIIALGILQGISEFLPISSSGHLVVAQKLMNINEDNVLITVVLHAGSLLSILAYYYRDIWALMKPFQLRSIGLLAAGTVPLAIIGYPLKKVMDKLESEPDIMFNLAIAGFFVSFIMLVFVFRKSDEKNDYKDMIWLDAILIGITQCIAVTPGISRSGSTISTSGRLGISPEMAARFSFFLGIAAIGAATVVKVPDMLDKFSQAGSAQTMGFFELTIGFFVSFAVGYVSIAGLIRVLKKGKMKYFGYYCLLMAIAALAIRVFE